MNVQDTSWHFRNSLLLSHYLNFVKLDQNNSKIITTSGAFKTILRKIDLVKSRESLYFIYSHKSFGSKLFRIV